MKVLFVFPVPSQLGKKVADPIVGRLTTTNMNMMMVGKANNNQIPIGHTNTLTQTSIQPKCSIFSWLSGTMTIIGLVGFSVEI